MRKIKSKHILLITLCLCMALSAYSLKAWSDVAPLRVGSYLVSFLIHIVVPMLLVWGTINTIKENKHERVRI